MRTVRSKDGVMPSLRKSIQQKASEANANQLSEIREAQESSARKNVMKQMAKAEAQKRSKLMKQMQVQCPTCGRRFNSRVADDHIKFCKEKTRLEENKKKWDKLAKKDSKKEKERAKEAEKGGPFESPVRERFNRHSSTKKFDSIKSRINTGLRATKKPSEEIRSPAIETPSSRHETTDAQGLSKFCTFCGHRFLSESHQFCGDCGQRRAYLE